MASRDCSKDINVSKVNQLFSLKYPSKCGFPLNKDRPNFS